MKDRGFDYIKNRYRYFTPSTPRAALLAVEKGLLPYEAFIYHASSIKPLYEEPFDTWEIDRILAKPDIDLEQLLLIIQILQKLVVSRDQEIALFAAESLNRIEQRFTTRIDELRGELKENPKDSRICFNLAQTYFEFSRISGTRRTLRNFYLREAYEQLKGIDYSDGDTAKEAYVLAVKVLIELKLYAQADTVLLKAIERCGNGVDFLLLQAENAFYQRKLETLPVICAQLQNYELDADSKALVQFWIGST